MGSVTSSSDSREAYEARLRRRFGLAELDEAGVCRVMNRVADRNRDEMRTITIQIRLCDGGRTEARECVS